MENLLTYFPNLTSKQQTQFVDLQDVYKEWNEKINVISRKDMDNFYINHVLHSLSIAKIIQFKKNTSILDLGTGGGFPGIPLAILFPECNFHLADSIGKKILVVNEVAQSIGLTNVKAEQVRVETLSAKYDFVVTRAVARLIQLNSWIGNKFKTENKNSLANGLICLKGGDLDDEIKELNKKTQIHNINDLFNFQFFETKKITYTPYIKHQN